MHFLTYIEQEQLLNHCEGGYQCLDNDSILQLIRTLHVLFRKLEFAALIYKIIIERERERWLTCFDSLQFLLWRIKLRSC